MSRTEKISRLQVLFHIWRLVKDLDYEVSFNGISEHTGIREAIWLRVTLSGGRECLIAPVTSEPLICSRIGEQKVPRLIPQSVVGLREFISIFHHPEIQTFSITDFGFYCPPPAQDIFAIRASSPITKQEFHFLITEISDPEGHYLGVCREALQVHFDGAIERVRLWIPLADVPQGDIFCAKNQVYFKSPGNAASVLMGCSLQSRAASMTLSLEEESMMDLNTPLPARLVLSEMEIGLDAYLSLSVGDEIHLSTDENELPVTLEIGGISVAQGFIRVEAEQLRFQVRAPSVGNIFQSLTNRVRTIPHQGGHQYDEQDSSIDTNLSQ